MRYIIYKKKIPWLKIIVWSYKIINKKLEISMRNKYRRCNYNMYNSNIRYKN